jgi:hypothetical protein
MPIAHAPEDAFSGDGAPGSRQTASPRLPGLDVVPSVPSARLSSTRAGKRGVHGG